MKQNSKTRTIKKFKQEVEKLKPEEVDKFNKEIIRSLDINKAKQNSKTAKEKDHKCIFETDYRGYTFCQICGKRPRNPIKSRGLKKEYNCWEESEVLK